MTVKFRTVSIGTGTGSIGAGTQIVDGPGEVLGLAVDYAAAADAGTVFSLSDGKSSAATTATTSLAQLLTITGATDLGTTVPLRTYMNGRLISGTSTANVHAGYVFFDGLFANIATDVSGPQVVRIWYRPLIRKDGNITSTGSAGSAAGGTTLFSGPGLLKAARTVFDPNTPGTADIQIYDGLSTSGRALTLVSNNTAGWAAASLRALSTTTGIDQSATVTTAANAHENDGILFYSGIHVGIAQSNSATRDASVQILVEA